MGSGACPICGIESRVDRFRDQDAFQVQCKRCGLYTTSRTLMGLLPDLSGEDGQLRPYLSAYTRQAGTTGAGTMLTTDNWRQLAEGYRLTPVPQKLRKALRLIADRSSSLGTSVLVDREMDYPAVDAANPAELDYLLDHLREAGHLSPGGGGGARFVVTVKGWEQFTPPLGGALAVAQCFVGMSFHPSLNPVYDEGIRPAIIECGFDPVRIDLVHHNEKICDLILAEIRASRFMVADFTLQRAGVYFEAGFAMGLGRPVIWMCREDDFANTHFDTRQYNHIVWADPPDVRQKLSDRVRATILGPGR